MLVPYQQIAGIVRQAGLERLLDLARRQRTCLAAQKLHDIASAFG